jgi:hypothetical protein
VRGYFAGGGGTDVITFPDSQFNLFWTAQQESVLLQKLLKKIKGHELHMGVALAEVDKLAGTVLGTVRDLGNFAIALSRGKFAQAARIFGAGPPGKKSHRKLTTLDISGRFLEMRYAWTPAIQDAYEAAKAFVALSNGPRQVTFTKMYRTGRTLLYDTNYCRHTVNVEVQRRYTFEQYEEMSFARQLGLVHPYGAIWERVPWSFVIDWFIPIGTYLELIGQVPYMKGRWLRTESYKESFSGTLSCSPVTSGGFLPAAPSVDSNWERCNVRRTRLPSGPVVPFPRLRVAGAVHGKRVQNALALAHQLFMSKFTKTDIHKWARGDFLGGTYDTHRYKMR